MTSTAPQTAGTSQYRGAVGAYKDFQIHKLNKETELHGTDKFSAASFPHYLPTWENEKGRKYISPIFHPAILQLPPRHHILALTFPLPQILSPRAI
jgi:hypothetical protein